MYIMSLTKEAQLKIQKIFHGSRTKIHKSCMQGSFFCRDILSFCPSNCSLPKSVMFDLLNDVWESLCCDCIATCSSYLAKRCPIDVCWSLNCSCPKFDYKFSYALSKNSSPCLWSVPKSVLSKGIVNSLKIL